VQDGQTALVEVLVECPKCKQENVVRVATGQELETLQKSVTCAYCSNPWVEYLPGQLISGPVRKEDKAVQ
jgi:DNA-directed RNA polymerase subunit M/transcription elongation factor TFIIS